MRFPPIPIGRTRMEVDYKKARQLAKLEKIRARGRTRYILQYGVLGWGVFTALLFLLFMCVSGELECSDISSAVAALVIFPAGGIWHGSNMWNGIEDKVRELSSQATAQQTAPADTASSRH